MDFTVKKYTELINSLISKGYTFQTFENFVKEPKEKTIVLRHDVDLLPENSLLFAKIQYELGIKGTYYFRATHESWNENIIMQIAEMGHEVGYHYESLTTCNGNIDDSYNDFCNNLNLLRKLAKVETICMHGSPKSKYDSRDIWKKYDYKKLGIIGEPYFDVDFDKVFYLTDTGRSWNGWKTSVRDKLPQQKKWINDGLVFRSTNNIIKALLNNKLPIKILITFHPQRWTDNKSLWIKEFVFQNAKNLIKRFIN